MMAFGVFRLAGVVSLSSSSFNVVDFVCSGLFFMALIISQIGDGASFNYSIFFDFAAARLPAEIIGNILKGHYGSKLSCDMLWLYAWSMTNTDYHREVAGFAFAVIFSAYYVLFAGIYLVKKLL